MAGGGRPLGMQRQWGLLSAVVVGVPALQVSVDHLRALNTTLLKLQDRQQDLERAVSVCREQLHDLLQEPGCQGCADRLHWAGDLELGADFSQVQAGHRPLEQGGSCA